jgi:hypothetical protein
MPHAASGKKIPHLFKWGRLAVGGMMTYECGKISGDEAYPCRIGSRD